MIMELRQVNLSSFQRNFAHLMEQKASLMSVVAVDAALMAV